MLSRFIIDNQIEDVEGIKDFNIDNYKYNKKLSSPLENVMSQLKENNYEVVLIGAGVRRDDDHFLTFEKLVNVVHEFAPNSKIAFNTGPTDSDAAVQRWA
jgi:hypothetical protein